METLAYLYHAEAYEASTTKPTKKSRKKGHFTKPTNAPEPNDVAFSWMP